MSNHETFEPMGLVDLTLASAQAKLKKNRERLDDMTERMQSALDAKRDAASAMSDELQEVMKRNQAMWQSGYEAGIENGERKGYDEGYKAGRDSEMRASEQRDRELLEEHGIDVEPLFANVQKIIADHETGSTTSHEQDIDEDEPDQYPPEKWGGTK